MSYKKFLGAASAALMIVIALTLVLAPAAGAASKYKVLHAFNGKDGAPPMAASSSMRPEISMARPTGRRLWLGYGLQANPER